MQKKMKKETNVMAPLNTVIYIFCCLSCNSFGLMI